MTEEVRAYTQSLNETVTFQYNNKEETATLEAPYKLVDSRFKEILSFNLEWVVVSVREEREVVNWLCRFTFKNPRLHEASEREMERIRSIKAVELKA